MNFNKKFINCQGVGAFSGKFQEKFTKILPINFNVPLKKPKKSC